MSSYTHIKDSPETALQAEQILDCDVAVIGGGGGGLSLLWALARHGYLDQNRVVLIEPQSKNSQDRTWCFWAKTDDVWVNRLSDCISHKWTKARAGDRVDPLDPYAYYQVRSADFYAMVKDTLSKHSSFEWIRESVKDSIDPENGEIPLSDIRVRAKKIFDSRTSALSGSAHSIDLWQSFLGYRIRTEQPEFDPQRMDLMNFEVPQKGETQFLYLLPTADNELLIELTRFGQEKIDADWADEELQRWLSKHVGAYNVLEREQGAIPMSQALDAKRPFNSTKKRIIPIGTAAGAVKPTTGYAFYNMVTHGDALAQALIENTALPTTYRKPRYRFYDRLLLDILDQEPEWGKPIFKQLFQRIKTPKVLTFLREDMRLHQEIPLLFSLPIAPFLRALDRKYLGGAVQTVGKLFDPRQMQQQLVLWLTILLFGVHLIVPQATQWLALPLLIGGLIFPGIPHGAVDHVLDGSAPSSPRHWLTFIAVYISIMIAIVGVWWASPAVGLVAFLGYSAWHFGETDLKHWGVYNPLLAWGYGLSMLGFLLGSHPGELSLYLHALGLPLIDFSPYAPALAICILGIILPLFKLPRKALASYLLTVIVVAIGVALPLLLTFALYFVGLHSWRAWRHLRAGLQYSDRQLLRAAAPFSLAAYVFIAAFVLALYTLDLPFEGVPAAIFLFLAAVSAPHIWMMHGFYGK